jgi:hypothetical protein
MTRSTAWSSAAAPQKADEYVSFHDKAQGKKGSEGARG